jgi:hypothetical protein
MRALCNYRETEGTISHKHEQTSKQTPPPTPYALPPECRRIDADTQKQEGAKPVSFAPDASFANRLGG